MSLPKPNVRVMVAGEKPDAAGVRGIVCNPVYTGVAPYPPITDDAIWIAAAKRAIKEDGIEQFLVNMLYVLRQSMDAARDA